MTEDPRDSLRELFRGLFLADEDLEALLERRAVPRETSAAAALTDDETGPMTGIFDGGKATAAVDLTIDGGHA